MGRFLFNFDWKSTTLEVMDIRLNFELERDGFAILPDVFGAGEVESLIGSLSDIADAKGVRSQGGVCNPGFVLEMLSPRTPR